MRGGSAVKGAPRGRDAPPRDAAASLRRGNAAGKA
jgi:hypothetical protein